MKKIASIILCLALVFSVFPTALFAANTAAVKINGQLLQDGVPVQCGNGTAVLDVQNSTLTLNNATINQDSSASPGTPVLRADNGDLKIVLIGENTITSTTQRPVYLTSGEYTIQGTENDSLIIKTDSDGLQADGGNLTIDGCKIDITSSSYGGMICLGKYNTGEFGILTIQNCANISINSFENTLMGEYGLVINDSTVKATARSNQEDWPTSVVSSYGNMSIVNSAVTATANGEEASAVSAGGTVSINNSEVSATTTSQTNAYTALSGNNIYITNHSHVTVKSAGTIGIWSPYGSVSIQDSIAYVAAYDEWPAIRGDNGGTTISGSWVEAFGSEVSPELTSSDSAIFFNNEGSVSGSLVLPGNVAVSKDMQLSISNDASITVPAGVTLTNHGTIYVMGSLVNNGGAIICDSHAGGTATCTAKAICSICGAEYGDLGSDNHVNLIAVPAKAATCTAAGNNEYWYCSSCKKYFGDAAATIDIAPESTVIPAKGHKIDVRYVRPATCELEGNSGELYCTVCGQIISTNNIIPKLGHSFVDGICIVCGAIDPDYAEAPYISRGAGSTWITESTVDLEFTSTAEFAGFISVWVDGETLDASYYTVREGSTIVTLKASYLDTLSFGKHTIGVVSTNGTAQADFYVTDEGEEITVEDPVEGKTVNSVTENVGGSATTVTAILVMISAALAIYKIKA